MLELKNMWNVYVPDFFIWLHRKTFRYQIHWLNKVENSLMWLAKQWLAWLYNFTPLSYVHFKCLDNFCVLTYISQHQWLPVKNDIFWALCWKHISYKIHFKCYLFWQFSFRSCFVNSSACSLSRFHDIYHIVFYIPCIFSSSSWRINLRPIYQESNFYGFRLENFTWSTECNTSSLMLPLISPCELS